MSEMKINAVGEALKANGLHRRRCRMKLCVAE
jgi:hypothetical protein